MSAENYLRTLKNEIETIKHAEYTSINILRLN